MQFFVDLLDMTADRVDGMGISLKATVSGQRRIYYKGNPPITTISETGQAKVIQE
jgi:hypothetical protein